MKVFSHFQWISSEILENILLEYHSKYNYGGHFISGEGNESVFLQIIEKTRNFHTKRG